MRCLRCQNNEIDDAEASCPRCGQSLLAQQQDLLPAGTLLGGGVYKIEYPLGRGGFGITYRAIDVRQNIPVAIKEFYPSFSVRRNADNNHVLVIDEQEAFNNALQRFAREGQLLAKIEHINIPQVYSLFNENNTAYLVMQFIDGNSLRWLMHEYHEKKIPQPMLRSIMHQIVDALSALHTQHIYHLDIKPENILITSDKKAYLIDLGSARQIMMSTATQSTTRALTPAYAPRELFIPKAQLGPESDIFELAMLIHEMLTGTMLPNALDRSMGIKRLDLTHLPKPWIGLLANALKLERTDRPSEVYEWWHSVIDGKKYIHEQTTILLTKNATPISNATSPQKQTTSTRRVVSLVLYGFVGAMIGIVLMRGLHHQLLNSKQYHQQTPPQHPVTTPALLPTTTPPKVISYTPNQTTPPKSDRPNSNFLTTTTSPERQNVSGGDSKSDAVKIMSGVKYNVPITPLPIWGRTETSPSASSLASGSAFYTIGSTKNEVATVQGTPTSVFKHYDGTESWGYDFSSVDFENGRVKSYHDISHNLMVKMQPSIVQYTNGYFVLGSTKDEVIAVQGTPTSVFKHYDGTESWGYDFSSVDFENGRVKSYHDISHNLKVKVIIN